MLLDTLTSLSSSNALYKKLGLFSGDYTSAADAVPKIEIGKVYTVTGSDGKDYNRVAYMPDSCHAYYLVTNDAIKTVIYGITTQVGLGLDNGISSYADYGKISTVWQWKDIGLILMLMGSVGVMFAVAAAALKSKYFSTLKLRATESVALPKGSPVRIAAIVILALLPVALYRTGILASRSFLGMNISKLWLIGGTNNAYISWQWTVSLGMLVFFLIYYFVYGRKNGGNLRNYGFATGDADSFHMSYILKAFLLGFLIVGSGYLAFAIISSYTKQGMHIATFMVSTINPNRTLAIVMYFLFQIPYFLISNLTFRSIGIDRTESSARGTLKTILWGMLLTVGALFVLWLVFILFVTKGHTLTSASYFSADRMYIYTIAILPLFIGMSVANALNIYVSKKTNSIWSGLFTAILWGTWIIISCGGMSKYLY